MNTLWIDVATDMQIVMLSFENQKEIIKTRLGQKDHSAYMIPLIDEALKEANINLKKIDRIIVGVGPGSYTGIRVAVMTAKMLAYTNDIPLYEISSLYLLTSGYENLKTPMIDARNQNYFSGVYENEKIILEEALYPYEALEKYNNHIIINNQTIKINIKEAEKRIKFIEDPHTLVPNYLRKTEAERNHDQKDNI